MTLSQLHHYLLCLDRGCSESLAEMLALGEPPMSNTDREFLEGRGGCYDQFQGQPEIGDYYAAVAGAQGVDITGKVYLSGLAAYPGDPRAWVGGRGDVRSVCEERGWGCTGSVNMPVTRVAQPDGGFHVAADIVEDRVAEILQQVEEPQAVDTEDLRDQVEQRLKPVWAQ